MTTLRQTTLILVIIALCSTAVLAQPGQGRMHRGGGDGDGPNPEMRLERMKKHLELTDAQAEAIEAIMDESRAETREIRKQIARLQNQKQGEMLNDDPSAKVLTGIIEKMGELRTEMQVNRMETRLAIREQLDDEQRDKMSMMGRKHGSKGPRGQHGQRGARGHGGCQ